MKIVVSLLLFVGSIFAVVDMFGRDVEVKSASRLIFVGPGAIRLGVYLGLDDRLVGVEQSELSLATPPPYRKALDQSKLKTLPLVGSGGVGKTPDLEAIINAKPDLIIASFLTPDQIVLIEKKTKVPVVAISYGASYGAKSGKKLDEVKRSILLLGEITGTQKRAKELVGFIESEQKYLKGLKIEPKVLYIGAVAYKGPQGIVSSEADYLPFELIGQRNGLFAEGTGHKFVDLEAILRLDPEWIFLDNHSKHKWQTELNNPSFQKLRAFRENRVKEVLALNNYNTNIENSIIIAHQIASDLMGKEIDIKRIEEIYKAFYPNKNVEIFR